MSRFAPPRGRVAVAPPVSAPPPAAEVVHINSAPSRMAARQPYEPPAALIPDPPKIPGKWEAEYTSDRKQYVVPGLDGIKQTETFTRATTHAKVLDDSSALIDWKQRATVLGLARNPEFLDELSTGGAEHISELDYGAKKMLNRLANKAGRSVGTDDASLFGTKLHAYLEALIEGVITMDDVPDELRGYLEVLFAAMRKHGLSFMGRMVERTVFIPATGMVGTMDFATVDADGVMCVGDLKTSGSIDFSWVAIAVQLAQYANATMMLSWDGSRWEKMPQVSKVIAKVASVPKDAPVPFCRIYSVDLTIGAELMHMATRINQLRSTALRCASHPELRQPSDEMVAFADGEAVTAYLAGL
ncbi:hypothetical protein B8W67_05430 [Mycolicibacillus koreensis]|uniref:Uncharacterized protein n=1 Tax=Mycolicibacillus koreensis TaxID=1069220 RepID=A0AA91SSF1_9MYCO|nr:hypothetical protein B8W67_05430 [Mycolicibacillus koreensis]